MCPKKFIVSIMTVAAMVGYTMAGKREPHDVDFVKRETVPDVDDTELSHATAYYYSPEPKRDAGAPDVDSAKFTYGYNYGPGPKRGASPDVDSHGSGFICLKNCGS